MLPVFRLAVVSFSLCYGVAALPRQARPFKGLPLPYSPLSLELGHRHVDVIGQSLLATLTLPP